MSALIPEVVKYTPIPRSVAGGAAVTDVEVMQRAAEVLRAPDRPGAGGDSYSRMNRDDAEVVAILAREWSTREEWEQFLRDASCAERKLRAKGTLLLFAIADALLKGEDAFGEESSQILNDLPYAPGYIENMRSVARRVAQPQRRPGVLWGHYQYIAKLPPPEQDKWLDRLEAQEFRNRDLFIAALKDAGVVKAKSASPPAVTVTVPPRLPPPRPPECPRCQARCVTCEPEFERQAAETDWPKRIVVTVGEGVPADSPEVLAIRALVNDGVLKRLNHILPELDAIEREAVKVKARIAADPLLCNLGLSVHTSANVVQSFQSDIRDTGLTGYWYNGGELQFAKTRVFAVAVLRPDAACDCGKGSQWRQWMDYGPHGGTCASSNVLRIEIEIKRLSRSEERFGKGMIAAYERAVSRDGRGEGG